MGYLVWKANFDIVPVNPLEKAGKHSKEMALGVPNTNTGADNMSAIFGHISPYWSALQAVCEASVVLRSISFSDGNELLSGTASGNEYATTKAVIRCSLEQNNGASATRDAYRIPAPAAALFNADGSVNTTNSDLITLEQLLDNTTSDPDDLGSTMPAYPVSDDQRITDFLGGYRS